MSDVCPVCMSPVDPQDAVCPSCNFHLAGQTQKFKPLSKESSAVSNGSAPTNPRLKMVRGPRVGATFALDADKTTIGRNPGSDIFLNDMTVSRSHATIARCENALVLADENSFNGVWVNNATIQSHALRPGDYIQIGKYDFVYEEGGEEDGDGR